jgi:processing peptidase subunit alpha
MNAEIEALGGHINCSSSREAIMYQGAVFSQSVPSLLRIFSQVVRYPEFTLAEIEEQKRTVLYELEDAWSKPETFLQEELHVVGFKGNTLGNPLLCPYEKVEDVTCNMMKDVVEGYYRPDRMVVAGIGMEHDKMVQWATEYFGDMPKPSTVVEASPLARYTGGMRLMEAEGELSHLLIGFEGLSIRDDDIYALATLQMLLGGGGSFSAGGPGKGMYSRLYTNVLNQFHWVESCQAFNHCYTDSGLFGIHISCAPFYMRSAAEVVLQEFARLCDHITHDELQRAKNQLKSSLLMNSESRLIQLEDLGRQVQVLGQRTSARELCSRIDKVTTQDAIRTAQRILRGFHGGSNTQLKSDNKVQAMSVLGQGMFHRLPDLSKVARKYGILAPPKN